jgi:hypothetical protein
VSQIDAVETGLKRPATRSDGPRLWRRDDKGDETWWLRRDEALICVVMDQAVLLALAEDETDALVDGSTKGEERSILELRDGCTLLSPPRPTRRRPLSRVFAPSAWADPRSKVY